MTAEESTARRLCWIYPDRGTAAQRTMEHEAVWDQYRAVAEDLGLEMSLHAPEEVAIDARDPRDPRFYLRGERITPEDTILVTHFYTLPHQAADVCNQATLYAGLEEGGFYLPIPPRIAFIGRDKLATMLFLADSPVPTVPTVRIGSGRSAMSGHYDVAFQGLDYPLIVKPAYWGMGLGVSVVSNIHDLRGVIGLAGGSDTALVVQPYLGQVREGRIFVIDGKPHTILQGEKEGYCMVSTRALGGRHKRQYVDSLEELDGAVAYAASRLRTPYFTLDFLHDGERYWISEIEPDGAVGFSQDAQQAQTGYRIVHDRFQAYLRGHREWIAARERR
ncbi:glutathione synthase/RimK-type ligase-like ATP-grasp enzyme [Nocardiopsis mwathae]|uniref:Glutathione synthase/RimK-type ligase-like ATP-grasp enzyme n=1 Tax=Nocardiopsis mwathae TaxID=1472723 RepID=A0A7W9YM76_9ACTN|nr:hypothetical protein [Nocardiopsis mwathae]MBB6174732.1 glutathione synthase/RimK-type ligase-like ATP-grasp enzyme [Nocardiopsis mwathae]